MRLSVVASTLTGVSALMIPSPRIVKDHVETHEVALEKRVVVEALVMAAATATAGQVAIKAIDAAIGLVKDLSDWTEARESFTQKVTAEMWSKNPSPGTYVAAICYNMDYTFANADHSEVTKVELKSGSLHTNYDCMFMQKGNTFSPQGDGGFINYSYNSDGSCNTLLVNFMFHLRELIDGAAITSSWFSTCQSTDIRTFDRSLADNFR